MIRTNPYEVAFEAYLRERRIAYVAVDESRRALLSDTSLKSMDFIAYRAAGGNLLIDVKGRRRCPGRNWENWATVEDIRSLTQWEQVFGGEFRGLLVFAYEIFGESVPDEPESIVSCQGKRYALYGTWLEDYRNRMQQRSPSWQTVWLPAARYREARFPLSRLWNPSLALSPPHSSLVVN